MLAFLRHPALHFITAGAVIFAAVRWLSPVSSDYEKHHIIITEAEIAELRSQHVRSHGEPPTEAETAALVEGAAIDEMLYREAIARGLDTTDAVVERRLVQDVRFLAEPADTDDSLLLRQAHALGLRDGDPVIRRRLIQRMRSVLGRERTIEAPTAVELASYFSEHRQLFVEPPQVRLSQIYFSGADATQRANAALSDLNGSQPGGATGHGEPFISGPDLPFQSERSLAKFFGPELARNSMSLPVGQWSAPLRSPYGVHLIWVHERRSGQVASFDAARDAVRRRVEVERAATALRDSISDLRRSYRVEIEDN